MSIADPPATCPQLKTCLLHTRFNMAGVAKTFTALYCEADFARCERYRLVEAGSPVPETLLPNGKAMAMPTPSR